MIYLEVTENLPSPRRSRSLTFGRTQTVFRLRGRLKEAAAPVSFDEFQPACATSLLSRRTVLRT
jgi:hypothetical protein